MITVIGCDGGPLRVEAATALARATLVAGGRRHLESVPVPPRARTVVMGDVAAAVAELAGHDGDAAIVASGDPGFFGIVRTLRAHGLDPVVYPAASSVAHAFARIGLPWDDAVVVSAHGRDRVRDNGCGHGLGPDRRPGGGLRRAVNACRALPKVAVLTGPGAGPAEIGAALSGLPDPAGRPGFARHLVVCEDLGGEESVTECTPEEAAGRAWRDPNVVLVLPGVLSGVRSGVLVEGSESSGSSRSVQRPELGWAFPSRLGPAFWALPEDQFAHRNSMITKMEVRALALARLGPGLGDLVWDVGTGSGSVAVECARFGAAVVAVDQDPAAYTLVTGNAAAHGVTVHVVTGAAPPVLAGLPDPDAVFVGGGGPAVVAACADREPRVVVAAVAAVDRVPATRQALASRGYTVDGVLLQAARLAPLSGAVRLAATNPVFLLWGERP